MKHWLLSLLTRMGRVWGMVDFYGDIQVYRAFPFWYEPHVVTGWKRFLPNLFIHFYPGEPGGRGPDGDVPHSHPWNSLGVVVRGEYSEIVNEKEVRVNRAWRSASKVGYKEVHRILTVKPGSISFFFHGPRRKDRWDQHTNACATPCKACAATGKGCVRDRGTVPFSPKLDEGAFSRNMVTTLIRVDKNFDRIVSDRQKLIRRTIPILPVTNTEKIAQRTLAQLKELS